MSFKYLLHRVSRTSHLFSVSSIDRCLIFKKGDRSVLDQYKEAIFVSEEDLGGVRDIILAMNKKIEPTLDDITKNEVNPIWGGSEEEEERFQNWYASWLPQFDEELNELSRIDRLIYRFVWNSYMRPGSVGNLFSNKGIPLGRCLEGIQRLLNNRMKDSHVSFPYEDELKRAIIPGKISEEDYFSVKRKSLRERVSCDQGFIWNVTRHLSGQSPARWTAMMRQVGLIGAIDYGTETIHPNEPTQAVFFDPGSIRVIDVISNVKPQQYFQGKHEQLSGWSRNVEMFADELIRRIEETLPTIDFTGSNQSLLEMKGHVSFVASRFDPMIKWLNTHKTEKYGWNNEFRGKLIQSLQGAIDFIYNMDVSRIPPYSTERKQMITDLQRLLKIIPRPR
jgi:hypothetical protein